MIGVFNAVATAAVAIVISMDRQSVDLSHLPAFGSEIRLAQYATM
jgi:hypothetical protein